MGQPNIHFRVHYVGGVIDVEAKDGEDAHKVAKKKLGDEINIRKVKVIREK